jgi:hypothetical protein
MGKVLYPGYFPYECQEPPDFTPWESDLTGYMKMYWRVKTWKVTCTLTGYEQEDENGGIRIISPGPGDYVFTYGWDAENEESLVCPTEFKKKSGRGKLDGWSESAFYFYWACNNETYSPGFGLLFAAGDDSQDPQISHLPINDSQLVDVQLENFSPETSSIKLYTQVGSYWGGISIKIRADEYWSYGGTYNTSTGEPLLSV